LLLPALQLSLNREIRDKGGIQNIDKILSKYETFGLINALSTRKVHDINLWTILIKRVLSLMQQKELDLRDVNRLILDLRDVKIIADYLFQYLATYISSNSLILNINFSIEPKKNVSHFSK
jgi:hypothetical protein